MNNNMIHECPICQGTGKIRVGHARGLWVYYTMEPCSNSKCEGGMINDSPFRKLNKDENQQSLYSFT